MPRIVALCKCAHKTCKYTSTYLLTHIQTNTYAHIHVLYVCVRSCARTFQLLGSRTVTAIYCQDLRSGAKQTRSRTQSSHSAATDGFCHCKCEEGNLVSCSVLQCVAVCCSVLQCVAVCCSIVRCAADCCSVLQRVAACCSVLQSARMNVRCI